MGASFTRKVPADQFVARFQKCKISGPQSVEMHQALVFLLKYFFTKVQFKDSGNGWKIKNKKSSPPCSRISAPEIKPAVGSRASPPLIKNPFALPFSLGGLTASSCVQRRGKVFFFQLSVMDLFIPDGRGEHLASSPSPPAEPCDPDSRHSQSAPFVFILLNESVPNHVYTLASRAATGCDWRRRRATLL